MRKLILLIFIASTIVSCGILKDPYHYLVRETRTGTQHKYVGIEWYNVGDTIKIIPSGSEFVVVDRFERY